MYITGVIHKNATINICDDVFYNFNTKQATVKYTVTFDDVVYERLHNLTAEETSKWQDDDDYIIGLLCEFNGFTINQDNDVNEV